jgi:hypothetical protein
MIFVSPLRGCCKSFLGHHQLVPSIPVKVQQSFLNAQHVLEYSLNHICTHRMQAWTPDQAGLAQILQTLRDSTNIHDKQIQQQITMVRALSYLKVGSSICPC